MEDFNITGLDKLSNYERLSPSFSVFKPLEQDYYETDPTETDVPLPTYNSADFSQGIPSIDPIAELPMEMQTNATINNPKKAKSIVDQINEAKDKYFRREEGEASIRNKTPSKGLEGFKQSIANVESNGGNYKAFNPAGGGEGAVGKYQFRWTMWKPQISKQTGITNKEDFMNNPQAQEDFFDYYYKTSMVPSLNQIKRKIPNVDLNDDDILKLIHFQGAAGAEDIIRSGDYKSKRQSFNLSPEKYLTVGK